jgi:hypothetical protein
VTPDVGYSNLIMVEELKKLYKIKLYMDEVNFNFKDFRVSKYDCTRRRRK